MLAGGVGLLLSLMLAASVVLVGAFCCCFCTCRGAGCGVVSSLASASMSDGQNMVGFAVAEGWREKAVLLQTMLDRAPCVCVVKKRHWGLSSRGCMR